MLRDVSMEQSLGATLLELVAGALLGGGTLLLSAVLGLVLVLLLAEPLRLNQDSRVMVTLLYLVPTVAALFGFNQTRQALPPRIR